MVEKPTNQTEVYLEEGSHLKNGHSLSTTMTRRSRKIKIKLKVLVYTQIKNNEEATGIINKFILTYMMIKQAHILVYEELIVSSLGFCS